LEKGAWLFLFFITPAVAEKSNGLAVKLLGEAVAEKKAIYFLNKGIFLGK